MARFAKYFVLLSVLLLNFLFSLSQVQTRGKPEILPREGKRSRSCSEKSSEIYRRNFFPENGFWFFSRGQPRVAAGFAIFRKTGRLAVHFG